MYGPQFQLFISIQSNYIEQAKDYAQKGLLAAYLCHSF